MTSEPIHVLLVEDNPADADWVQELVADAVGAGAVQIETVGSLAAARERLAQGGIGGVLLDLQLPDSAGIDTVDAVHAAARGMPIVVLTGTQDETAGIDAVRADAQDYLLKGRFDGSMLVRAVRYAAERQRLIGELDHLREEFAAFVAHDLRNPIQAASLHTRALVRQMEEKLEKTEDVSRLIEHAHQTLANLQRISNMVNDLIDAARIEL
jgi:DNA-binding NarL/FixJ family response regulator